MNNPEVIENQNAPNTSTPASGSVPALPNKFVALEGRLKMERHPYRPPISCDKNCRMDMKPFLCGIALLESMLENFNGKYVRITFETEALNSD